MDIQSRRRSILKGFVDNDLEKARSGVYANTYQNKKLGRVGQKYGSKEGGEQTQEKKVGKYTLLITPEYKNVGGRVDSKTGEVIEDSKKQFTGKYQHSIIGESGDILDTFIGDKPDMERLTKKLTGQDSSDKVMQHDMAVFKKVIEGHKKEDRDTYDKLTDIYDAVRSGDMEAAMRDVKHLDTYQRELIPPRIYKKMGGTLTPQGEKKADIKNDLDTIAATGTKKQLYDAVNKKYGTKFKVGDIDEFEDNSFRKELTTEDIEAIVDDEQASRDEQAKKKADREESIDIYETYFKGKKGSEVREGLKAASDKDLARGAKDFYQLGSTTGEPIYIRMHEFIVQEQERRKKSKQ